VDPLAWDVPLQSVQDAPAESFMLQLAVPPPLLPVQLQLVVVPLSLVAEAEPDVQTPAVVPQEPFTGLFVAGHEPPQPE
jgi:hypothetical protein